MRIALTAANKRHFRPVRRTESSRYARPVLPESPRLPALDPGPAGSICERLLNDAAIIARINRGDEDAADALVTRLRPTILKCLRRPLPRWVNEEDLLQAVFVKVFHKLHQFSGAVPLEHWVSRIAVNTSLSQMDYESVRPEMRMSDLSEEQEAALQNTATTSGDSVEREYAREALELLLRQLKPDERRIVVLLHVEQRSTHEISRMTGLSVSSIKVKAFRTRHKMRRLGQRLLRVEGRQIGLFSQS